MSPFWTTVELVTFVEWILSPFWTTMDLVTLLDDIGGLGFLGIESELLRGKIP